MESANHGRPSSYREEFADQARKLCLLGATDKDLAYFFDVCEATINNWKLEFSSFLESVKNGKTVADMHVAQKLFDRATGAEWIEDEAIKVKRIEYDNGKKVVEFEEVVTVPVRKAAPPDTTAGIFWLKNRKSDKWRDRHEVSGADGGPIELNVSAKQSLEVRIAGIAARVGAPIRAIDTQ